MAIRRRRYRISPGASHASCCCCRLSLSLFLPFLWRAMFPRFVSISVLLRLRDTYRNVRPSPCVYTYTPCVRVYLWFLHCISLSLSLLSFEFYFSNRVRTGDWKFIRYRGNVYVYLNTSLYTAAPFNIHARKLIKFHYVNIAPTTHCIRVIM